MLRFCWLLSLYVKIDAVTFKGKYNKSFSRYHGTSKFEKQLIGPPHKQALLHNNTNMEKNNILFKEENVINKCLGNFIKCYRTAFIMYIIINQKIYHLDLNNSSPTSL